MSGIDRATIYSTVTDFVEYSLYFNHSFKNLGIKELWIRYVAGDSTRYIPLHEFADIMGPNLCKFVLKAHVFSRGYVTFKVTQAAALKSAHENCLDQIWRIKCISYIIISNSKNLFSTATVKVFSCNIAAKVQNDTN